MRHHERRVLPWQQDSRMLATVWVSPATLDLIHTRYTDHKAHNQSHNATVENKLFKSTIWGHCLVMVAALRYFLAWGHSWGLPAGASGPHHYRSRMPLRPDQGRTRGNAGSDNVSKCPPVVILHQIFELKGRVAVPSCRVRTGRGQAPASVKHGARARYKAPFLGRWILVRLHIF